VGKISFLIAAAVPLCAYAYYTKHHPNEELGVDKAAKSLDLVEFCSRQWSECTSSTLQGLSALITILGAAHLFRQSCSNRKDIDHKSYFAGGVVLTILALNPFPHARIIGAIVAVASFNLLRKPPKLLH